MAGLSKRTNDLAQMARSSNDSMKTCVASALANCHAAGFSSVAICLVHGYRYPEHENRIGTIARDLGFAQVSVSHEVESLIKFVSRAETTLADAYLTPVLNSYIDGLRKELLSVAQPDRLLFMQSNGGLTLADNFRGKNSVLSGPAAGVVGMVETASKAGLERLIGFDMGGTSTDVSAWSGDYERSNDSEVAGVRLRAPMMKIHTIAAGGGSIIEYKDERLQVGPESAGANPGPACYRRGGPLTVTDANLLLGRIPIDQFPNVFGPEGDQPLDVDVVRQKFASLAGKISLGSAEKIAEGVLTVAVESMANAIRKITIERGEDVRDFVLCSFGGAAGQHACKVAEVLGIEKVWLHPLAGVLSAYGMGLSDIRVERQRTANQPLSEANIAQLQAIIDELQVACDRSLAEQNVPLENRNFRVSLGLRVKDSDTILDVAFASCGEMVEAFAEIYRNRFGAAVDPGDLLVATLRVEGTGVERTFSDPEIAVGSAGSPIGTTKLWCEDAWVDTPIYHRDEMGAGSSIMRSGDRRRGQRHYRNRPGMDRIGKRQGPPVASSFAAYRAPRNHERFDTRPGTARSIQPALHAYRRTDGDRTAKHCPVSEHSRTSGFLMRAVRCRWQTRFKRAAHAGTSWFDGRKCAQRNRAYRRSVRARRCDHAELTLQRWHSPA